jgi:anthranilate synthase/aminodeoxychorismate synthase-like glutamine amidotransferase
MVLVIDNYDSFTYNLVQYLGELGAALEVRRNDEASIDTIREMRPERLVISPGPGRPEDAGISVEVIRTFGASLPVLGVCLGHQAIGIAFGGRVIRAPVPIHGKTSMVDHDGRGLFSGMRSGLEVGRYHSLVVSEEGLPPELEVSARTRDGQIVMGLRHREWPVHGLQFHPESVLTREGRRLLRNFLELPGSV